MLRSTVICLVLLRLAIGWHFFFEGLNKVRSTYTPKPFSSEIYFREAEGPLGEFFRSKIGDPDQLLLARLSLPAGGDKATEKLAQYAPEFIRAEWQAYAKAFESTFKLDAQQKELVQAKLEQGLEDYVRWLKSGKKKVERDFSNAKIDVELTTAERTQEFRDKIAKVREFVDDRNFRLGKNVEKTAIPTAKADVAKARAALQADVDAEFGKFKSGLAAVLKLGAPNVSLKLDEKNPDAELLSIVKITPSKDGSVTVDQFPGKLTALWAGYAADFKSRYQLDEAMIESVDGETSQAKLQLVRKLLDLHPYSGTPLPETVMTKKIDAYAKLVAANQPAAPELTKARSELLDELDSASKKYVDRLESLLKPSHTEAQVKAAEKSSFLEWNDWLVRWSLTIMGACLLIGFMTRISAIGCAGFLFLTYLAVPALPWLPSPPNSEGNYVFVNKNVVEMLALMVIATVPSGRWFGLDGLVVDCLRSTFGGKSKDAAATPAVKAPKKA
ncbi:DoxX family protein [Tuwongella immobilis]|uniref:DoxX n=1 Tax=Tuwongella immobilis TaxID=692036 RepID=A0A6C2YQM3_9BACT|nr:DoxX family protein [Tuwongella immobilis]VIP03459.1 Uncharacterized protein OS=Planctomyces maris DSM 8797 GN=PM8797T_28404 PE=4 SV=1: DoxX [Tuwongella immobilis]VTS04290.1 Uncharacterized protein OS=Planctomyces maris DSM 8797 GN=PM8797T_28404 PE=4 SV=1: DoxX [Tuwongella immobilis]